MTPPYSVAFQIREWSTLSRLSWITLVKITPYLDSSILCCIPDKGVVHPVQVEPDIAGQDLIFLVQVHNLLQAVQKIQNGKETRVCLSTF